MDPKNIERYSRWARPVLEAGVRARMLLLGIAPAGEASRVEAGAASAGGAVLSAEEARMRDALLAELDAKGEDELVRRAAYTWFNRLLALRYLELKGLLPHGRHVLSDASGTGLPPEAASEPEALNLPTLPREAALRLKAAGDAQATFRAVLVAQAGALAKALPKAFGPEGDPLALLLPDGLLGPEGAVRRLVEDVPAADLVQSEALGWAYQYWVAEERAAVETAYKREKRSVTADEIPAVTQLFTPDWIVSYLVENSLGRLWMLNVPDSPLAEEMPYYIAPEGETEPTLNISSPEEITFCDPACGSGHMMLAAFRLLGAMYEEVGYRRRDVPALVLANNLSGMEIDPRAAQLAELCLALEACSWDRGFLAKPTDVDITVLQSVSIDPAELPRGCALAQDEELLDALANLSLCGSLLGPSANEISEIKDALRALSGALGDADLERRLNSALACCEALNRQFSVVVTNPPYMGSKKMPVWLRAWTEERYPDSKRDLCTCFIERGLGALQRGGYVGLATSNVWMFIGSYEVLRRKIIDTTTLDTLVQLSLSGFKDVSAQVCAFVLENDCNEHVQGGYIRLSDFSYYAMQGPKTREAIQNPECGWFYRCNANNFKDIPGAPIVYWASDAVRKAFREGASLGSVTGTRQGTATRDNNKYLRFWHEIPYAEIGFDLSGMDEAAASRAEWFPYNKGGEFRKWYGNASWVVRWFDSKRNIQPDFTVKHNQYYFKRLITWGLISSSVCSFRLLDRGFFFDVAGMGMLPLEEQQRESLLAFCNSSVTMTFLAMLAPTMNFQIGDIMRLPVLEEEDNTPLEIAARVNENLAVSRADWDSFETSWGFASSPLIPKKGV